MRLRDFKTSLDHDYDCGCEHDLHHGRLSAEREDCFETEAVWLCFLCIDVGRRSVRKLAHMAEDLKEIIHQIHAQHSSKTARKHPSSVCNGVRSHIKFVRGGKVMLSQNIAHLYSLAHGLRGKLVGAVYPPDAQAGTFPKEFVSDVPELCGPFFYLGETKWVTTSTKCPQFFQVPFLFDSYSISTKRSTSFTVHAFFARIHFRLQQANKRFFIEVGPDQTKQTFGDISMIFVGDVGQLEPIDDWSMCDNDSRYKYTPKRLLYLWRHAEFGK